jgi:hypothetical protein
MKTSVKIFLACALGSIVGLLTALSISHTSALACIIGMVIGGMVGYLAYDFKKVLAAIKLTWKQVMKLKLNKDNWRGRRLTALLMFNIMLITIIGILLLVTIISLAVTAFNDPHNVPKNFIPTMLMILASGAGFMIFIVPIFFIVQQIFSGSKSFGDAEEQNFLRTYIRRSNPLRIYFVLLPKLIFKEVPIFLFDMVKALYKLFLLLFKFVKKVFVLIHSDERLICMSYASAGALIGYVIPGTGVLKLIIGAVVGGASGFGAYELLFKKKEEAKQEA